MTEKWEKLSLGWILVRKWLVVTGQREFFLNCHKMADCLLLSFKSRIWEGRAQLFLIWCNNYCIYNLLLYTMLLSGLSLWKQWDNVTCCVYVLEWYLYQSTIKGSHHQHIFHITIANQLLCSWPTRLDTWSLPTFFAEGCRFCLCPPPLHLLYRSVSNSHIWVVTAFTVHTQITTSDSQSAKPLATWGVLCSPVKL